MSDALALIDRDLLQHSPPRRLPFFFLPNLLGEYLLARPLRSYFDLPLILGSIGIGLLLLIGAGALAWALLLVLVLRVGCGLWRLGRAVREDYRLLRDGVVLQAYVLGMRPRHDADGKRTGAFLDCVIPITRQRATVGSVWLPDADKALRLRTADRVSVICLPRAPGSWRLL